MKKMQYVVTPKTNTGYAVYYCEVEFTPRTRHVFFSKGRRVAGGGVPSMQGYYRYPYGRRWEDEGVYENEEEALTLFMALTIRDYNPKSALRQKMRQAHIDEALQRLKQLPPLPDPADAVEEDLTLTDEQFGRSIEAKPQSEDASG